MTQQSLFSDLATVSYHTATDEEMVTYTYHWHEDPQHGWLAVPVRHLIALDIVKRISQSSYLRGGMAYLEEDADAAEFYGAFSDRFDAVPRYTESYSSAPSFLRDLPHYSAAAAYAAARLK